MEVFLKSCNLSDRTKHIKDLGVSSVADIAALGEPESLCSALAIEKEKAGELIAKAKEALVFEQRKVAVQTTWKAVQDALAVEATQLFYQHLFQEYPTVKKFFAEDDMEEQAEALYETVSLAISYLDDVDTLIPFLEDKGRQVRT